MKPRASNPFRPHLFTLAALLAAPFAHAADGTWLGTTGNWNAAGTWSGGTIADGADSTAYFTGIDISGTPTITLGANRIIGNITFTDDTTSSHDLLITGNTLTLDRTNPNVPVIDVTQVGRTLTISSIVAGTDGLQKNGAGDLILSNSGNTYTGNTTISGGTLQIGGAGRLGNAATYSGAISIATGATLRYSTSGSQTFSGAITGLGGLTKDTSTSDLTLSNTGNNYSGTTTISAGRLAVAAATHLSSGATSIVQSGTGQLYISSNPTLNNLFNISTTGQADVGDSRNNAMAIRMSGGTLSNQITLSGNSRIGTISVAAYTNTISGKITGAYGIDFSGVATAASQASLFVLSNTNNDYTGNTTILHGIYNSNTNHTGVSTTLRLGASNVIPNVAGGGNVVFAINGTNSNSVVALDLNGFSETINGVTVNAGTFTKRITNSSTGASVLTIGANNTSSSFTGTITDAGAGKTLAITKIGTGTLTLSGSSDYIGGTLVDGGVLALASSGSVAAAGNIQINSGTLAIAEGGAGRTFANNMVLNGGTVLGLQDNAGAGGTIDISGGNVTHTFTSSGTLTLNAGITGASQLIVGGGGGSGAGLTNNYFNAGGGGGKVSNLTGQVLAAGNTTVTVGTGGAGASNAPGSAGGASSIGSNTAAGGSGATGALATGGTSGSSLAGGVRSGSAAGGGGGDSAAGTNAPNSNVGGNGGAGSIGTITGFTYGGGGGGGAGTTGGTGGVGGGGYGSTGSGGTSGTANTGGGGGGGGAGNTAAGGSGIAIVQYAYATTAGAVTLSGTIDLQSASTLDAFGSGGLLSVNGLISTSTGAGGLTIASSNSAGGVVRFGSANTYLGNTTVNTDATLRMNATNALPNGSGKGNLNLSGALDLNGQATTSLNGLSGTGTIDNIAGAGTYGLSVGNNDQTSSFGGLIQNTSGTLGLTKSGTGVLTLSNTSTYTGATDVNDGKLVINGNISTSSLTTVAVGATLGGTGTVGKTIINGTLAVGNSPGQMNFTDTLGLNGITTMEIDGTLGAGVTGGHDFVNLTGAGAAGVLTYGGTMTLDMGVVFGNGTYSWNLFDMASETGTFATIALADQYSGSLLDADLNGVWDLTSGSNTWQFTESTGVLGLTVVPEPRAALLGGLGMLMLLRRKRA